MPSFVLLVPPTPGCNSACGLRGHIFHQAPSGCRQMAPSQQDRVLAASARPPDICSAAADSVVVRSQLTGSFGRGRAAAKVLLVTSLASAAPNRNSLPSSHMRCMIIASLRSTATAACLWPRRFATRRTPRFQPQMHLALGQEHARRFVENGADLGIVDAGDVPLEVDAVARRDAPRRQPGMRADGLRSAKPLPLVDAAFEGERGYRPDSPR